MLLDLTLVIAFEYHRFHILYARERIGKHFHFMMVYFFAFRITFIVFCLIKNDFLCFSLINYQEKKFKKKMRNN